MKFQIKSILFLGVGGVSMHQLAISFKKLGVKVLGYDAKENEYTKLCEQNNIPIFHKFNKDFLNVDLCVKTGAIKEDNKLLKRLKKSNIKVFDRAEVLSWLAKKFKCVIAVAGTHGKSTTASLIYEMLKADNKRVSCHIGADVGKPQFEINDDFFVVEACEYNKSFLSLFPNVSVVTNIEAEHMECYGSLFNLRSSFVKFIKRAEKRFVFLDKSTRFLKRNKNINFVELANLKYKPKLKGEYNLKNISLAIAVARSLGVTEKSIELVVKSFSGIKRRYEFIGNLNNQDIYIDYAHHPTELKSFVKVFLSEYKNPLIVFQPHTYSRTKMFFKEFISILKDIRNLIIFKEYPARESVDMGRSAKDLYLELKKENTNVNYMASSKKLKEKLLGFDAVAFVGAGDINLVAQKIAKNG